MPGFPKFPKTFNPEPQQTPRPKREVPLRYAEIPEILQIEAEVRLRKALDERGEDVGDGVND